MEKIRIYPDECLQREADPVEDPGECTGLIKEMREVVSAHEGIGLAGPQVGAGVRVFLMRTDPGELDWRAYFNPEIIGTEGEREIPESCLSFPGVTIEVNRASRVTFRAYDSEGQEVEKTVEGLLAQCVQHEVNHLDGITLIDHANLAEKLEMQEELQADPEEDANGT